MKPEILTEVVTPGKTGIIGIIGIIIGIITIIVINYWAPGYLGTQKAAL